MLRLSLPPSLAAALIAALAAAGPAVAQTLPADAPPFAVGMVDQPCPPSSFGRSEVEQAFARTVVADGPLDPKVLAPYAQGAAERAKADAAQARNDWPDLCRYARADAEAIKAGGVRVVFLGDSITELWQAADPALFSHGVVDRGVSGQTTGQAVLRFYPDVVALHPKAVHILVGTNDVAGNTGPSRPEDFKNNIRAMVDMAKANHVRVILASITPAGKIPWRVEIKPVARIRELNAWLAGYAKAKGLVYVDYYAVLATPEGAMKPGVSRDGVHPLRSGYALMKPLTESAMAKALARPAP